MQDQQILNSTITIEEVIDKGKKLSIKGNNGQRVNTYSIWKTKQDGTDSAAYAQYKTMGLTVGSSVFVGYVIDEFDANINGQPKRVRSNKIINFRESNEVPPQTSQTTIPGRTEANRGQYSNSTNQSRNFDQEGYEKCAWTYFIEVCNGELDSFAKALQDGVVHDAFQAIKADSSKHFSPLRQAVQRHAPKVVEEDLPVIQQEELDDIGEGIPF